MPLSSRKARALRDFCFPSSPFFQFFPVIIHFGINPLGITVTGFDTRRCGSL